MGEFFDASEFEARHAFDQVRVPPQWDEFPEWRIRVAREESEPQPEPQTVG